MDRLTGRQEQCLTLIRLSIADRGHPPTRREIGEWMGIRSTNGVSDHLMALERKGWLIFDRRKARGIKLRGEQCPCCNGTGVVDTCPKN